MTDLATNQKTLYRCLECNYTVEVYGVFESFSIKCHRCDERLENIGDLSQIDLSKYDEGLSYWVSFGCPDCYCEEVSIDCSVEDQICCECLRPECGNYDVFRHEDT